MINSTSFGIMAEPLALSCRDDVVVESGDAAPKSCLPSLEMRTTTAASGLLPTDKISTAMATFNEPLLQFYSTEEADCIEDFDSIRLVRQQRLEPACCLVLPKGHRDKIGRKQDIRSRRFSRSSPRLPAFGIVARVALWRRYACWSSWVRLERFSEDR